VGEVLALSALPEAEEDEGGGKGVEDRGSGLGEEREDAAEVEELEEEVGGAVGKVAEGLEEDGVVIGPDILNGGEVSAGGGAVNLFHGGGVMEQAGADELRSAVELEEIVLADSDAGPGKLGSEEDELECAEKPKKEPHTG
jgi:hypothetical protein